MSIKLKIMPIYFVTRSAVHIEESLIVIDNHLGDHYYKNIFKDLTTKLKYGEFT